MLNLKKILIFLIIFTASCHSTYIKTDEMIVNEPPSESEPTERLPTTTINIKDILDGIVKEESQRVEELKAIFTENDSIPQSAEASISKELNSDETKPIFTGDIFEIHLTIKHNWSDDFVDPKSKKFTDLSKLIDTDLISFFDNQLNKDNSIKRGSFMLKNVLPSSTDSYIYVTFIAESSENVTGQIMYEKIENWLLLYNKFYELEFLSNGFEFKALTNEELKKFDGHIECDNQFCNPTPEQSTKASNLFPKESETTEELPELLLQSASTEECKPNEKINRGSTSIYIFDNNHECVDNVKKRSLLSNSQQCSGASQNRDIENESSNGSENYDELVVAASENYPQTSKVDDAKDDEVIVVVRKRGDKVFIEI
ncbi:hypothetical protein ACKWTF_016657 [Chironomus riparius]